MNSKDVLALATARNLCANGQAKQLRIANRLSLQNIADAVGSVPSCVWRWERGERAPQGAAAVAYGNLLRDLQKVTP